MSSDRDHAVYLGSWINWTKGRVLGATITMTPRDSAFLVAFFALFVRLVGSHMWSIFCYITHQWRSKRGDRDAFHHQQQALLRNSSSVATTLWLWLKVSWAWRSKTRFPLLRSCVLVTAAVLQIIAFGIAGLYSSNITISDKAALARSPSCGSWPFNLEFEDTQKNDSSALLQAQSAYDINARRELTTSLAYAQSCYQPERPSSCHGYIVPTLSMSKNYKIDYNASCPFDEELCRTQAVEMDTGFVDSATHLGINSRKKDRVLYRRTASCAVLNTEGYSFSNISSADAAYPYNNRTYFSYGESYQDEFTYHSSNYTSNGTYDYWYDVATINSLYDFTPLPAFHGDEADIDIIFLRNYLRYLEPVDDPWFSAHTEREMGHMEYMADSNPSPLGCFTQHQVCNPNLPSGSDCTALASWNETLQAIIRKEPNFNDKQEEVVARVIQAAYGSSISQVTLALDTESLLATQSVAENQAIGLPPDQWKKETVNFNSIILANIQSTMVSYATGPMIPSDYQYLVKPNTTWQREMCNNQIITQNEYFSFSILGISLIISIGGLMIITNLSLEPFIRSRRHKTLNETGLYRQLEWDLTETLQLQRLVYEGQGTGTWKGDPEHVPVTAHQDKFGIPGWTGEGEARRISRDVLSLGPAGSPLMKDEKNNARVQVTGWSP